MSKDIMPEASQPEPETRGPEFRRLVRVLSRQANCDHVVGFHPTMEDILRASEVAEIWSGTLHQVEWFKFCPDCGKQLRPHAPEPSAGNPPEAL